MAMNSVQFIKVIDNFFDYEIRNASKETEEIQESIQKEKQWFFNHSNFIDCVNCKNALWVEIVENDTSELHVVCEKVSKVMATFNHGNKANYPRNCYFIDPNETE